MEKLKVYRTWERGKNKIAYVYRDKKTGKKRIGEKEFKWWFYVKTSDYKKHRILFEKYTDRRIITDIKPEGKYTRIYVDRIHTSDFLDYDMEMLWEFKDWNLNQLINDFQTVGIQTFEKDVSPAKRFLLQDFVEIESDYNVLYYDIETDDRKKGKIVVGSERILSFAILDEKTGKSKFVSIREDTDEEEKRILLILAKLINKYDILVAWNGNYFDNPYIKSRFMRYGIKIDWRKVLLQDHLQIFKKHGQKLQSYSLDNVGAVICNERKVEHLEGIYEMWENNKKLLKEYNLQDVKLMFEIEKRTKYLAVARDVNVIGKCPVDDIYITRKIDNMMLMSAQRRKHYHFKTKIKSDDEFEKFKGAVVFEPKPGLYEDVKVLDFSSLYPNSIKTCNISPDTLITDENRDEVPEDKIITTITGAKFRKDFIGILPEIIMSMKSKRDYYKKQMAKCVPNTVEHKTNDRLQYVYKSFGLSFYGAIGETHSRFYNVEVAEAVTQTGVYFNKLCAKYVEKNKCTVIYGDTDSSFIHGLSNDMVDVIIDKLAKLCRYKALNKFNCDECTMIMDYDKGFRKLLLQNVKKRYAGAIHYLDGHYLDDEKLYIAGLEYKRTDSCKILKEKQYELIQMLLDKKTPSISELEEWVSELRTRVLSGNLSIDDIVLYVSITKELSEYSGRQLTVITAKQMIEDGKEVWVGAKIGYFIDSLNEKKQPNPKPVYKWKGNYHEVYYWNQKIYPALERILTVVYPQKKWKLYYVKNNKKHNRQVGKYLLW